MEDMVHLSRNWYRFRLTNEIQTWLIRCVEEVVEFIQPYDDIYLKAKRELNGDCIYKVVFSGIFNKSNKQYKMPICYILDINSGKFKGNRMHYFIDDQGTRYSDSYPVYSGHIKFKAKSKYFMEKRDMLHEYLNQLQRVIPNHELTSKERRKQRKFERKQYLLKRSLRRNKSGRVHTAIGAEILGYGL